MLNRPQVNLGVILQRNFQIGPSLRIGPGDSSTFGVFQILYLPVPHFARLTSTQRTAKMRSAHETVPDPAGDIMPYLWPSRPIFRQRNHP